MPATTKALTLILSQRMRFASFLVDVEPMSRADELAPNH
jgi:hypothetical protein